MTGGVCRSWWSPEAGIGTNGETGSVPDQRSFRRPDVESTLGGEGLLRPAAAAHALVSDGRARTVVLVEGVSDQVALEALAERRGLNLDAAGAHVVSMGGVTNIRGFLEMFGPRGSGVRLAGLYDAGEEDDVRRGFELAGYGSGLSRADLASLGFEVCVADLEDELIRAIGTGAVERVLATEGELGSFRTFQMQPAWRARTVAEQLRRFMGTRSGRKIRYARLLVDALDLTRVSSPLDRVLTHI